MDPSEILQKQDSQRSWRQRESWMLAVGGDSVEYQLVAECGYDGRPAHLIDRPGWASASYLMASVSPRKPSSSCKQEQGQLTSPEAAGL
jgi:hypothetical protein